MQDPVMVMGGLEKTYMQKLALYMNTRTGMNGTVELLERDAPTGNAQENSDAGRHWKLAVGSESFVRALYDAGCAEQMLILTQDAQEDEIHVQQCQSRSALYQKIIARYNLIGGTGSVRAGTRQHWVAFVGKNQGQLTAFSMLYAWILAKKQSVLYVCFSENSGLTSLFRSETGGADLGDLFLHIRKHQNIMFEMFTGHLEGVDYLQTSENPMILYEIEEKDLQEFLQKIAEESSYETVVFCIGSMICGCNHIFAQSEQIIHVRQEDLCSQCAAEEVIVFLQKCGIAHEQVRDVILSPLDGDMPGIHLLYEWQKSEAGSRVEQLMCEGTKEK